MKAISYSLFKDCDQTEWNYYLRGFYFNLRLNRLLLPDWTTILSISKDCYNAHYTYFRDLQKVLPFEVILIDNTAPIKRCEAMLWRLDVLFNDHSIERVICRDTDSIVTHRDKMSVLRWVDVGAVAHGMNDNPAHGGMKLMGGMCGFTKELTNRISREEWAYIKTTASLYEHGTDQNLLNSVIYPKVSNSFYFDEKPAAYPYGGLSESDLCCRHIGSAGVVEMELIRFFRRHDVDNKNFITFEKKYNNLMYWWQ
jgi:hypothetical protein